MHVSSAAISDSEGLDVDISEKKPSKDKDKKKKKKDSKKKKSKKDIKKEVTI